MTARPDLWRTQPSRQRLAAAALALTCLSCSGEDADRRELKHQRSHILALVGEARGLSLDQCRALPFGSKPCGGPWEYLVFSIAVTDSANLAGEVAAYNALERGYNRKYGKVSDCSIPPEPELALRGGLCMDVRHP